jgi:hypothetical protein
VDILRETQYGGWDYVLGFLRDYGYVVAWIGSTPAFDAEHRKIVCPHAVAGTPAAAALAGDQTGAIVFPSERDAQDYWHTLVESLGTA